MYVYIYSIYIEYMDMWYVHVATESYSTVVWNIKYSAVLAAVIKSRGSIAGV